MLPLFDDLFWPPLKAAAINGIAPAGPRIDVGAGLRAHVEEMMREILTVPDMPVA